VVDVRVEAFIASLNDAVMTATPVAPFKGFVELTVGATVSPGDTGLVASEPHPAIVPRRTTSAHGAKYFVRRFMWISLQLQSE
jgi:hypothetical protein